MLTLAVMKRTLSLLVLIVLPLIASADVVIERATVTVHFTGQGIDRSLRFRDVVVRDLDGTNGASITTITIGGRKLYSINRGGVQVVVENLRGPNGRTYTVIARGATETNEVQVLRVDAMIAKGLNGTLRVTENREINSPRVFRANVNRLEFDDGEYLLTEAKETRVYSQTETRAANANGEDVEAVLDRLIQKLQASGYVEAD
jgi:hypothetical protein